MTAAGDRPLLVVGEIVVDFTSARKNAACKLRLGGIVHAARGLWACGLPYSVAAICPSYLVSQARAYLAAHGCIEFIWLGEVSGAPNVMVIGDATEVSDQGYEDLLRTEKSVTILDVGTSLSAYAEILVFPGSYDLSAVRPFLADAARISFDIAYGTNDFSILNEFAGRLTAIIISTSSQLFARTGSLSVEPMLDSARKLGAEVFLLKENRGGSRLFDLRTHAVEEIPATLSNTVNSVGVGDVYSAVMIGFHARGWIEAGWRSAKAATVYSQTTFPDDFRRDTKRELALSLKELRDLGGTVLPWHDRPRFQIYLAAPDFSYLHKPEIDRVVEALGYHNFLVRRPVVENGELPLGSLEATLFKTYAADIALLEECSVVFAIPLERDPGTLIEMGMAMAVGKPVVTFDPRRQNENTMVIGGSTSYSNDLDTCLNALFVTLSDLRKEKS
ncbi:nucleoside 2-deoxyribosyltransferase [Aminobacter sp. HY435]|uniref:nucleoside 2-deoxyribosyltransferase n=1 Tax=Aminobacter sp. HY435 TaxID=2970917 RepID=UPI0022B9454F|nr:nucleoside 2-deoxyribosyltransferase [Aminobacter sp. HY435]